MSRLQWSDDGTSIMLTDPSWLFGSVWWLDLRVYPGWEWLPLPLRFSEPRAGYTQWLVWWSFCGLCLCRQRVL